MNRKNIFASLFLVLVAATVAGAQTSISGAGKCEKPDPQYQLEVGDRPNHILMISRLQCTWTKPWELAGVKSKGGAAVVFDDVSGNTSHYHAHYVDTMENGDKVVFPYQGTATLKDGVMESGHWTWILVGATGKMRGIQGEGACQG
ncbi:MAG: hypothetical protein HY653_07795, partial [Acidobacteria bacterium]|nr:hypothetical protein [Acidobacteriota bacterium]